MDNSIKDVCAEVTCLHASGLRKVAVVALGCTAVANKEKHTGQGMTSGGVGNVIRNFQGNLGQWSYSARPLFMDRFFPCTQELESLKDFERDRILGTSKASSIVFLFPALKISRNGGELCSL